MKKLHLTLVSTFVVGMLAAYDRGALITRGMGGEGCGVGPRSAHSLSASRSSLAGAVSMGRHHDGQPVESKRDQHINAFHPVLRSVGLGPLVGVLALAGVVFLLGTSGANAQTSDAGEVPERPTGLSVSSQSHDSVTLTWDDPGDNSIQSYQILRRSSDGSTYGDGRGAAEFVVIVDDTGSSASSYTDTSVMPRRRYVYRVKARNRQGLSQVSSYANAETPGIPPPPAAPRNLTADGVAPNRVELSWDDPQDSSITGYQILRRSRDGPEYGDGLGPHMFSVIVDDTGSAATNYIDTTAGPRTRYAYALKARSPYGLSRRSGTPHAEIRVPPAAPTGLALVSASRDGVTLTWDGPGDGTIGSYQVIRRPRDGSEYGDGLGPPDFVVAVDDTGSPVTSYKDTSVASRTRYTYGVKARNSHGLSKVSGWVNGETPPEAIQTSEQASRPNVVLILADDLGWGDVRSNNPDSAMITPRIDGIRASGANFTDGHSPSSVCSPTRYGLLTGRYAWRSWLTRGTLSVHDRPLIGPDRPTLGTLLQGLGYRTAAIGKWHLGMEFARRTDIEAVTEVNRGIDFDAVILDGPPDHGFDEFFGTSSNLFWQPHVYIRDSRFTANPDGGDQPASGHYEYGDVLDRMTEEAVSFIEREGQTDAPFFLYLPLHTPHTPMVPNAQFEGLTGLGSYADVVAQLDWTVGQVLDALNRVGARENTLVVFTSDNGSFMGLIDVPNHVDHRPNSTWLDGKKSIYEGGHRVPLFMQWPEGIEAGSTIAATVSLTDLYATLADIVGEEHEHGVATDSVSLIPLLSGDAATRGVPVIHHSYGGMFAIRQGRWKLVFGDGNGGDHRDLYLPFNDAPFSQPEQLYDIEQNPTEWRNVIKARPEVVAQMTTLMEQIRSAEDATLTGNAKLRALQIAGVNIGTFNQDVLNYAATVDPSIENVRVTAFPTATDARVVITTPDGRRLYEKYSYGRYAHGQANIELSESRTTITVTVTSPNKSATTNYTVSIRRVGLPTVSGTALVGETLTADTSHIADEDGLGGAVFSYQWIRNDGTDDVDIPNATSTSYLVAADDVGKTIRVGVTFTDDAGNEESLISQATAAVEARPNNPATGAPTITGTAQVGETLTAGTSGIADEDGLVNAAFSYQWTRNDGSADADIQDATASTYTLTSDDESKAIKVRVTFTDDAGNEESLTSEATALVEARANNPATGAPTITGTAQMGETLTAGTSEVADADGLSNATFGFQWLTDNADIASATGSSYILTDSDEGKAISVRVSFTDDAGNAETLTSEATDAVEARANNPATGAPTITGTAQVGKTLTADTSGVADADSLSNAAFSFQWTRNDGSADADIQDATASTYTLTSDDEGKAIKVRVTFTDDDGNHESLTSGETESIAARLEPISSETQRLRPNVVLILADDLGWGDVRSNNSSSAMTTPHIDSIAASGVYFTDAHTPSSMCSPTRYGLLTGRYAWRTWLSEGVLGGHSRPLIGSDRPTLGTLLQGQGYRTAAIGKWHLGMDFARLPRMDEVTSFNRGIDLEADIVDGPLDHGFDEFFGTSANLRWEPHIYIRNRRFAANPERGRQTASGIYSFGDVLDRLTDEAVDFIGREGQTESPFFLYMPLHTPHIPMVPNATFRGSTGLGTYADVVAQMDWTVGEVLGALDQAGIRDDTLVVFTSDNGSFMNGIPVPNHEDHKSNGHWRGEKGLIFEGGHRVPLLMQWPAFFEAGSTIAATVSLTDLYATVADIVDEDSTPGVAIDSVSLLPLIRGEVESRGTPVVHHSRNGMFALRDGRWKLVFGDGNGGVYGDKTGVPFRRPWRLFDLEQDPREKTNIAQLNPDVVARMEATLERIRAAEYGALSADATLKSLYLGGADFGRFDPDVKGYTATVSRTIDGIPVSIIPTATDASVVVRVGRIPNDRGYVTIPLNEPETTISILVTAPSESATATYTVTAVRGDMPATGEPAVLGKTHEGITLRADTSSIVDEDGLANVEFNYQWIRSDRTSDTNIVGATDRAYTLVSGDIGKALKVRVTFTDDAGNHESLTSEATGPVTPNPNIPATGAPTISGTVEVGETLTADTSGIADEDGLASVVFNYEWLANDAVIPGANDSSYVIPDSDGESALRVRVSFTDDNGFDESLTSKPVAVEDRPYELTATVSGRTVVLSWKPPVVFPHLRDYQILRNRPELGETEPLVYVDTGTAETTYVDTDVEPEVLYVYRVKAASFWVGKASEPVEIRTPAWTNIPATGAPTISGTVQVGKTLTANTSGIADEDGLANAIFSYQWLANDAVIAGANDSSYVISDSDRESALRVRVSFTDDNGFDESLTSKPVAVEDRPYELTASSLDGAVVLTWKRPVVFPNLHDYQILRNRPELGETEPLVYVDTGNDETTYVDTDVEPGVLYVYRVKAASFWVGKASEPVEIRTPARANIPATGAPTITGTAQVGETLTANTSGIADEDGLSNATFSYQWIRNDGTTDSDIEDATDSTYTLVSDDSGKSIKVRVTFTDDAGNAETLTSEATALVEAAAEEVVWESALTVGRVPNVFPEALGYSAFGGTLSPDYFEIDGSVYNVQFLLHLAESLWLGIDRELPVEFTLSVGESSYAGSESKVPVTGSGSAGYWWPLETPNWSADESVQVSLSIQPQESMESRQKAPLTAYLHNIPSEHNGQSTFTFELRFSEEPDPGFSYRTLRDHAFTVTGGSVVNARRLSKPSNIGWEITVRPDGNGQVAILLPATKDCAAQGAICTGDGRMLFNRIELSVPGPAS